VTEASERRIAIVERAMSAPPEKLWRALTQRHLIEEWLMKNDFKPVPGHKFNLSRQPSPDVNVVIDCEVLTVEENKRLSYRWSAYGTDTVVTFTLTPTGSGTMLRVEQDGFGPNQKAAYKGAMASWPHFLSALDELMKRTD
jgi:uncharacterized protein YndB with AHSA1/START domain